MKRLGIVNKLKRVLMTFFVTGKAYVIIGRVLMCKWFITIFENSYFENVLNKEDMKEKLSMLVYKYNYFHDIN